MRQVLVFERKATFMDRLRALWNRFRLYSRNRKSVYSFRYVNDEGVEVRATYEVPLGTSGLESQDRIAGAFSHFLDNTLEARASAATTR